jgi:small subunit ribosomal protein S14
MKAKLERDRQKRKLVQKYEKIRQELKAKASDLTLPEDIRRNALQRLQALPRNSASSRIKNRCILTGRRAAVYRIFKLSRIALRKKALEGYLPGVHKASWLAFLRSFGTEVEFIFVSSELKLAHRGRISL